MQVCVYWMEKMEQSSKSSNLYRRGDMSKIVNNEETLQKAIEAATIARSNSYSPFSGFAVGAAVVCADGSIFAGTNIENPSYGATICAERSAIAAMVSSKGWQEIDAVCLVTQASPPAVPCALCLQVLAEFCTAETLIHSVALHTGEQKRYTFSELLPHPFSFSQTNQTK